MLLLNLILLIDVTFSTPTGGYTHNPLQSGLVLPGWSLPRREILDELGCRSPGCRQG